MTAACILKLGPIIHLSAFKKSKKTGLLISMSSLADISFVFNKFFITDATLELDKNKINTLGKITFAAMQGNTKLFMIGTPLLILMSDSGCKFIQISKLKSICDEVLVQKPCQFKLNFNDYSLAFSCFTSTDYTEWIQALTECHERILLTFEKSMHSYSCSDMDQEDQEDDESIKGVLRIASHLTFSS